MKQTIRSLTIIVIRYENSVDSIKSCLRSVFSSANLAVKEGVLSEFFVRLGDCSLEPIASNSSSNLLKTLEVDDSDLFEYHFFNENHGHSLGCNLLAEASMDSETLLFLNPDCVMAPSAITKMVESICENGTGAVDAKQIPCIHPKFFDPFTGETNWASGAALMVRTSTFRKIEGFDYKNFPMYVNDVDLSWRIRLCGESIRHSPEAAVFHDKRLNESANVIPTKTELESSLNGMIRMYLKYGRKDLAEQLIESLPADFEKLEDLQSGFESAQQCIVPLEYDESLSHNIQFQNGEYGKRMF